MRNKYKGTCILCKTNIEPKKGICFEDKDFGWTVVCKDCQRANNHMPHVPRWLDKLRVK